MLRRKGAVAGLVGLVVAGAAAGCGGGGSGPSAAMQKAVLDGCAHYLKPDTVATTLGRSPFASVDGQFKGSPHATGSCVVYIATDKVANATAKNAPYLTLEVYDRSKQGGPEGYAEAACDQGENPGYQIVKGPGPGASCATYRPDPPDALLEGGRIQVYGSVGQLAITLTIDGVQGDSDPRPTLKSDRAHGFRLLDDVIAAGK